MKERGLGVGNKVSSIWVSASYSLKASPTPIYLSTSPRFSISATARNLCKSLFVSSRTAFACLLYLVKTTFRSMLTSRWSTNFWFPFRQNQFQDNVSHISQRRMSLFVQNAFRIKRYIFTIFSCVTVRSHLNFIMNGVYANKPIKHYIPIPKRNSLIV